MPPHRPERLAAFLGKITRNTALDRYLSDHTKKRGGGQTEAVLDELSECVPDEKSSGCMADEMALREAINGFLASLPAQKRIIFVRRYWYMSSIGEIAEDYGLTQSNVKVTLLRTRNRFKAYLEKEGIEL